MDSSSVPQNIGSEPFVVWKTVALAWAEYAIWAVSVYVRAGERAYEREHEMMYFEAPSAWSVNGLRAEVMEAQGPPLTAIRADEVVTIVM